MGNHGAHPRCGHAVYDTADDEPSVAILGRADYLDGESQHPQSDDGSQEPRVDDAPDPRPSEERRLLQGWIGSSLREALSTREDHEPGARAVLLRSRNTEVDAR